MNRKIFNSVRYGIPAILLAGMIILLTWSSMFPDQQIQEKEVIIPINTHIEKEIQVRQMENKFIFIQRVGFGGAGAGGLGAPQIFTQNITQFSELVPLNESVYVSFEAKPEDIPWDSKAFVLKKTYWAFIENRAGLIIYEDNHQYSEDGNRFWLKEYTPLEIRFEWNNRKVVKGEFLLSVMIKLIVSILLLFVFRLTYIKINEAAKKQKWKDDWLQELKKSGNYNSAGKMQIEKWEEEIKNAKQFVVIALIGFSLMIIGGVLLLNGLFRLGGSVLVLGNILILAAYIIYNKKRDKN